MKLHQWIHQDIWTPTDTLSKEVICQFHGSMYLIKTVAVLFEVKKYQMCGKLKDSMYLSL